MKLVFPLLKSLLLLVLMLFAVAVVFQQFSILSGLDTVILSNAIFFKVLIFIIALMIITGSIINLFFPKWVLRHLMRVRIINNNSDVSLKQLYFMLDKLAKKLSVKTPLLAIYDSKDINAFATGYDHHNAIIVVSTGLLHGLNHDEQEAVLAHELSHITNYDMLTLSLMNNVLNILVMLPSHFAGWVIDKTVFGKKNIHGVTYYTVWVILQVVWGVLATILVMWFSRWREFRADKDAAKLIGNYKMQSALMCLKAVREHEDLPDEIGAFGISGHIGKGIKRLFVSHPPLTERIAALKEDWH